ncbi:YlbF family regulator [Alkalithermobacter paradoxus]|uniref:Uncharacterized protein n=1 Tax=Alkalithermobacter paradoxus TaxID=29349 RepID=A0A1V4IAP7_9FIRM|nr:hypothetical protein CLOTH_02880 [[Clostridium] thermoalcaliphilum]
MSIHQKAKELGDLIKKSKEFIELRESKSVIDKNKELKKKLEEFQKMQMEMYSQNISQKDMQRKAAQLNKTFESMYKIPEINRFLKASKEFNDMMSNIYKVINENIDIK